MKDTLYVDENGRVLEDSPSKDFINDPNWSALDWEPYFVRVSMTSNGWHVSPGSGLMYVGNWAKWHREYPKTEGQLRRSISKCVAWCKRENDAARERRVAMTRIANQIEAASLSDSVLW